MNENQIVLLTRTSLILETLDTNTRFRVFFPKADSHLAISETREFLCLVLNFENSTQFRIFTNQLELVRLHETSPLHVKLLDLNFDSTRILLSDSKLSSLVILFHEFQVEFRQQLDQVRDCRLSPWRENEFYVLQKSCLKLYRNSRLFRTIYRIEIPEFRQLTFSHNLTCSDEQFK